MIKFKCKQCGKIIKGKTEYDAEVNFEYHKCINLTPINELSDDELLKLIKNEKN